MLENTKEKVGERFKKLRESDFGGKSQTEMARLLGYKTQGAYSKIELGLNFPSIEAYAMMARIFKVRTQWLAYGAGETFMSDAEHAALMLEEEKQEAIKEMPGYREKPRAPLVKGESIESIIARIERDLAELKTRLK